MYTTFYEHADPFEVARASLSGMLESMKINQKMDRKDPYLSRTLLREANAYGIPLESLPIHPYKLDEIIKRDLREITSRHNEPFFEQVREVRADADYATLMHLSKPLVLEHLRNLLDEFAKGNGLHVMEPNMIFMMVEHWGFEDKELGKGLKKLQASERQLKVFSAERLSWLCSYYKSWSHRNYYRGDFDYDFMYAQAAELWRLLNEGVTEMEASTSRKQVWEYMQETIDSVRGAKGGSGVTTSPWGEYARLEL